jgi:non-ribosomal peptide synthetase component F
MFTSGTTGVPKGVAVRYDNVTAYLAAFRRFAPIHSEDRCSQFFDLSFDLSVHDMFVTWTNGACLCVPTSDELIDPVGFADRVSLSCWFSVPSVANMALRMRRLKPGVLPKLRLSLFCGEPLPTSLAQTWSECAPSAEIWNLYGPTEATIAITAHRFDPSLASTMPATVPLGDAYAGCAAVAITADGNLADAGEVGEFWLGGPQISDGYINNPAELAAKFVEARIADFAFSRWYKTGDLVRRDLHWGHVYEGRIDDQVKISGYRVELLEVEEMLRWAADTPEVAALAWPQTQSGSAEGVVGFVCGAKFEGREVIRRCRTVLPPYMAPQRIIELEALPLNANGKVDRKALRLAHLERQVPRV